MRDTVCKIFYIGNLLFTQDAEVAFVVEERGCTGNESILRVGIEKLRLARETEGQRLVVAVHDGDIFTPCRCNTAVQYDIASHVFGIAQELDTGILPFKFLRNAICVVGRAIIAQNQLPVTVALVQDRLYRIAQSTGTIIDAHHDRYLGRSLCRILSYFRKHNVLSFSLSCCVKAIK